MPLVYGQKAKGRLAVMPAKFADTGYTQPGEVYEIHLDTTSLVGQEEAVIDHLLLLEQQVPDLRVVYAEVCDCGEKVKFQIMDTGPGSIGIGGILALLPAIFVIIGVGIIAYMLWKLYNDVPVLLVVGGVAAAFLALYFLTGEKFFSGIKDISLRGPKDDKGKPATGGQKLEAKEKSLDAQAKRKEKEVDRLRGSLNKLEAQKIKAEGRTDVLGRPDPNLPLVASLEKQITALEVDIKNKDKDIDAIYKTIGDLAELD